MRMYDSYMISHRFLRQDWKSKNISVPPGHRVILSQFIEKVKQKIMLTPKNMHKRGSKRAEARQTCSKRIKVEESLNDHGTPYGSNLVEIASKIRKQIVKWQNSQKELHLKQLKEHKDFEIKVKSGAEPGCPIDVSITCKICNVTSLLGMHDKPNSFLISNWTCHAKNCRAKKEKDHEQKTLNKFLKPQTLTDDHIKKTSLHSELESTDLPMHDTVTVEDPQTNSTGFNNNNETSESIDKNQQVFRLAPPILHHQ